MSLSASMYRSYSHLYDRFSTGLFAFEEFRLTLDLGTDTALKHASFLRSRGYLTLFGRDGRSRLYRLLSPDQALFAHLHGGLGLVRQQRYLHLLVDVCMQLRNAKGMGLAGVWLYGSVARGEAKANSDVDLLVVARDLKGNRSEMEDRVYRSLDIQEERQFLYRNGISTDISVIPFREDELGLFYPILLDVLHEGIVLYEEDGVLSRTAESMRARASALGIRRVGLGDRWAWVLPPGVEVGKPIGVQQAV